MNAWGVDGCRQHRTEIIAWIEQAASERGWMVKIATGAKALALGLPLTIAGLVDLAITRAAARE